MDCTRKVISGRIWTKRFVDRCVMQVKSEQYSVQQLLDTLARDVLKVRFVPFVPPSELKPYPTPAGSRDSLGYGGSEEEGGQHATSRDVYEAEN